MHNHNVSLQGQKLGIILQASILSHAMINITADVIYHCAVFNQGATLNIPIIITTKYNAIQVANNPFHTRRKGKSTPTVI